MAGPGIDLNRGVTSKLHPAGWSVNMYKDDPGVFYDPQGNVVSHEAADKAGFDVPELMKQRAKAEALRKAREEVEAEFASREAAIVADVNEQMADTSFRLKLVQEATDEEIALYSVETDAGVALTAKAVSQKEAVSLLSQLTGQSVEDIIEGLQAESKPKRARGKAKKAEPEPAEAEDGT